MMYIIGFITKMILAIIVIAFVGFGILWILFPENPLVVWVVAIALPVIIWQGYKELEENR